MDGESHVSIDALQSDPHPHHERARDTEGLARPSPDMFDITRPSVRHLPFGHGVRSCPGSQLAREQLHLTLQELTGRLPGLRFAEGSRSSCGRR